MAFQALLGAGANMQCKSYFPVYHSTRDLSVDAHGSKLSLYNVGKTVDSGHYYNALFLPPAPERQLADDKEVIKQTMLKHEVMFRDQVHELHRLYRRQRELMDEIRCKELYRHHIQLETSQSNPFSAQISYAHAQKSPHLTSLPWVNPACNKPSVSSAENIQLPFSFEGKCKQTGHDFDQTEDSHKNSELLGSKCKKFHKKMLDLQLPADEYVDCEEGEWFEEEKVNDEPEVPSYPLKKNSELVLKTDVKLPSHCGRLNSVCQGDALNPDSFSRRTMSLVDLNEPFEFEQTKSLNSVDFLGPVTSHGEIHDLSGKTNTGFQVLSKETSQNTETRSDLETCMNILNSEKNERGRELLPCKDEAGQSRGNLNSFAKRFCPEKLPTSCKPLQVELEKAHEPPTCQPSNQSNKKSCGERPNLGLVISGRNCDLPRNNYPKPVGASYVPTSCQLVPQSDTANFESSSVPSLRKSIYDLNRNPIAVQALPCFNTPATLRKNSKSSIGSSMLIGDKIKSSKSLRNGSSSSSASSPQNGFCHESQLESKTLETCTPSTRFDNLKCNKETDSASKHRPAKYSKGAESMDVKFAKDMNLNVMPPDCSRVIAVSQLDTWTMDGEKLEDPSEGFPLLRTKPSYDRNPQKGVDLSLMKLGYLQAFSSCACDVGPKRVDKSQCSSNSHQSVAEVEGMEKSENVEVLDIYSDHVPKSVKQRTADDLVVKTGLDTEHSGFGNHIDLNSCINEDESTPTASVPRALLKIAAEIDLEAPVSPENEECSPPRGDSDENQLEIPFQFSGQDVGDRQEELLRIAAEAIVSISSSGVQVCLENATCETSESPSHDSLHWFAGLVSSMAGDSESEFGVVLSGKDGGEEFLYNGIDYFEAMTLKLTETKAEEYCFKSDFQKERETETTFRPRQQRKSRTRRGSQWKDFQSEVLPCLASLSRYEVTEDLQTIEGLMEAAGSPLETGLSRKNASRNRWGRGRRRLCTSTSNTVESTAICSLLEQKTRSSELGFEERGLSLTGWGKTTRRRRGQRYPATNLTLILSQV